MSPFGIVRNARQAALGNFARGFGNSGGYAYDFWAPRPLRIRAIRIPNCHKRKAILPKLFLQKVRPLAPTALPDIARLRVL
jgi:hypothetical protein